MHLEASDPTFIDALITPNAGRNDRLDRIDRLIDAANAAGEGTAGRGVAPSPLSPSRLVIPAKAGIYRMRRAPLTQCRRRLTRAERAQGVDAPR